MSGAIGLALPALMVLGLATTGVSRASFSSRAANGDQAVATLTVAPPPAAAAAVTLNVTPAATCRVVLSWSASPTPAVTGYEVVRVRSATGAVVSGPWTVAATTTTDNPVPLQLPVDAFEWRVRAVLGSWRSTWRVASQDHPLLCLL